MILLLANSVYEIYVSRFVLGIGGGIVFTAIPMYVGEIAEVRNLYASYSWSVY